MKVLCKHPQRKLLGATRLHKVSTKVRGWKYAGTARDSTGQNCPEFCPEEKFSVVGQLRDWPVVPGTVGTELEIDCPDLLHV